jgi:hypothetical protein
MRKAAMPATTKKQRIASVQEAARRRSSSNIEVVSLSLSSGTMPSPSLYPPSNGVALLGLALNGSQSVDQTSCISLAATIEEEEEEEEEEEDMVAGPF